MKTSKYILYEVHNFTNGRKYIGQHCTRDINAEYYGSSKDLTKDIEENGHTWGFYIVKYCKDIYELGDLECERVKEYKAIYDPVYYNKSNWRYYNTNFEFGVSEETRKKMTGKKRTAEHKKKYSESKLGDKNPQFGKVGYWSGKKRPPISDEHKKALHSKESIEKMKKSLTGIKRSQEFKDKISNTMKGVKKTEETKQRMRDAQRKRHNK